MSPAKEKCGSPEPTSGRGNGTARGIAVLGQRLDRRTARIRKPEQFRGLVEGLAGGIVDGGRQPSIFADALHFEQLAMAARHEQQEIRKVEVGIDEARASAWPSRWLIATSGLPAASASPFPASNATITPPIRPGPAVAAIASTSRDRQLRRRPKHAPNQVGQDLHMRPRGDFRHHAAIRLVRGVLADNRLREDATIARHQRYRAVIARRFKAEDQTHFARRPFA